MTRAARGGSRCAAERLMTNFKVRVLSLLTGVRGTRFVLQSVKLAGRTYDEAAGNLKLKQVGVLFGHFGFLQTDNSFHCQIGDDFVLVGFLEWRQ